MTKFSRKKILFKTPNFRNLKLDFFPMKKVFRSMAKWGKFSYYYLIMTKVSRKKILFKTPNFRNLKLDFFPMKKVFCLTAKWGKFSYYYLIITKVSRDLRTKKFSLHHH